MRQPTRTEGQVVSLFEFLHRLEEANASFRLGRIRHESILVEVYAPGEHWEVEFMEDGSLEIERFRSGGDIFDADALADLWELFSAATPPRPKAKASKLRKSRDE